MVVANYPWSWLWPEDKDWFEISYEVAGEHGSLWGRDIGPHFHALESGFHSVVWHGPPGPQRGLFKGPIVPEFRANFRISEPGEVWLVSIWPKVWYPFHRVEHHWTTVRIR